MKKMFLVAAVVAIAATACSSSADDANEVTTSSGGAVTTTVGSSDAAVSVKEFAFSPGTITVAAGTAVTWTNNETGVAHTTTSDDGVWNSQTIQPGEDFTTVFADPGTFTYFCSIHPSMTATIVVEG
jgi:plastocyanin